MIQFNGINNIKNLLIFIIYTILFHLVKNHVSLDVALPWWPVFKNYLAVACILYAGH